MTDQPDTDAETADEAPALRVEILILAAGSARRMRGSHKLLALFDGVPLIRRTADIALSSRAAGVTVVTGHRRDAVHAALTGLTLRLIDNPHYHEGMGTSLACGVSALDTADPDGILVMLADMPQITVTHLDSLLGRFEQAQGAAVVRAASGEKPGNPVILPRPLFPLLTTLAGDEGARRIIAASGMPIIDLDLGPAALFDIDTPEALTEAGGVVSG
ncbi:molybdopterin-guanine dinucleotide biosynthesis protein MobA [Xaviernesmea oryzae]|uniref:Molybdopterin-guanine dinucleotide biosynthesis protein MobA n=1 Tax=Xaviernesmea oryzae TaxID=464029 RepID=A0A1Q9B3T4_9HYPH|nr:nucleotidyltransferase family protein [Xaviernesmea oryzae]OLP62719.1 molybdopterin-guanine dinucleotide biosynthesis protein MobA [Xaviernesmea oryzae]SEM38185.1 molybdenum cofactor cytidylyltransferase [Xaviernesmea oryzae]